MKLEEFIELRKMQVQASQAVREAEKTLYSIKSILFLAELNCKHDYQFSQIHHKNRHIKAWRCKLCSKAIVRITEI